MLEALAIGALIAAFVVFAIVFHELGHYAATILAGVPAEKRRLALFTIPPHVAFRDEHGWATPFDHERYSRTYRQYDPDGEWDVLLTGGGFLAQLTLIPVAFALAIIDPLVGLRLVNASLGFAIGYLVVDVTIARRNGAPWGDATHLWALGPRWATLVVGLLLVTHLLAAGVLAMAVL